MSDSITGKITGWATGYHDETGDYHCIPLQIEIEPDNPNVMVQIGTPVTVFDAEQLAEHVAKAFPGEGCTCTPHSQSAGPGYTEHLLEYEPNCPEHSVHVWNPRAGMWELLSMIRADERAKARSEDPTDAQIEAVARHLYDTDWAAQRTARMPFSHTYTGDKYRRSARGVLRAARAAVIKEEGR